MNGILSGFLILGWAVLSFFFGEAYTGGKSKFKLTNASSKASNLSSSFKLNDEVRCKAGS